MTSSSSQRIDSALDKTGSYVCNGLDGVIHGINQRGFAAVTEFTKRRRSCCHN